MQSSDVIRAIKIVETAVHKATQAGGGPLSGNDEVVKLARSLMSDLQDVKDEEERERSKSLDQPMLQNNNVTTAAGGQKKRKMDFNTLQRVSYKFE